jgi:hypothetical protein
MRCYCDTLPKGEICWKCIDNIITSDDVDTELDLIRKDLVHQLNIPDELDWDYFLETAIKAKRAADDEGRNMVNK